MGRAKWILGAILGVGLSAPAHAQRVTLSGFVNRVDPGSGVIELRGYGGRREILVNPDAEIIINGCPPGNGQQVTLGDLQFNADISILGWRDRGGMIHADTLQVTQTPTAPRTAARTTTMATRSAAIDPGSVISGQVAGIIPTSGTVILNTPTGYRNVALGTAPIMLNGRDVTIYDLALGDYVQLQRTTPPGGLSPTPSVAVVLTPQQVAGSRQTFRSPASALPVRPGSMETPVRTPETPSGFSPGSF